MLSKNQHLYKVKRNDRWGYINSRGEIIFELEADSCWRFSEGLGVMSMSNELHIVDADKTIKGIVKNLYLSSVDKFGCGLLCLSERGKENPTGYVTCRGDWAIEPSYRSASTFCGGVAVASYYHDDEYGIGLIDLKGNWLCERKFETILDFVADTSVTVARQYDESDRYKPMRIVVIDKKGNQVGTEFYEDGHRCGEGLAPVKKHSKWGFVNEAGDVVIPFSFEGLNAFSEGLAAARSENGKIGAIDKTGHWVIHPEFTYLGYFSEGLCPAQIRESSGLYKWGFIDRSGTWVIEPQFDEALEFEGGLARVHPLQEDREAAPTFGYIDASGRYVWPPS